MFCVVAAAVSASAAALLPLVARRALRPDWSLKQRRTSEVLAENETATPRQTLSVLRRQKLTANVALNAVARPT